MLYDHNIESLAPLNLQELISKRLQLLWQLDKWQESLSSNFDVLSAAELVATGSSSYDAKRFQILLSIQYYRTLLLVNYPVLNAFLNLAIKERKNGREFAFLLEATAPVVKNDLMAANELQGIITAIAMCPEPFLDRNAAWWVCNSASKWRVVNENALKIRALMRSLLIPVFTVSLHVFGILLACKHHETLLPGRSATEVRSSLDSSLETMRMIERTSLMSCKARHCLMGLMKAFDSFSKWFFKLPKEHITL